MTKMTVFRSGLRRALAVLGLLALGALPLWLSAKDLGEWKGTLEHVRTARGEAIRLLEEARREDALVATLHARLQAFAPPTDDAQNEALPDLASIRSTPQIFNLDHQVHPGTAPLPDVKGLPRLRLRRLVVDVGLLHEDALIQVITALPKSRASFAIPLGCSIARTASAETTRARLTTHCEFDWLTVHAPPGDSPP